MPWPGLVFEGYALFVLPREFLTSFDFRMLDKDDRVLFIIFQKGMERCSQHHWQDSHVTPRRYYVG